MTHDGKIDYAQYPGTIAPRRFELINTKIGDDAVYGYGVEMYCGMCLVERPGALEGDKMLGFARLIDVQQAHHIRWIDPPFERGEATENHSDENDPHREEGTQP